MSNGTTKRFGLAALLGIPIGIMSAFVKWGRRIPVAAAQSQGYV